MQMSVDSVYSALRSEMTQTLFAFRQLLIGELAGYAALIGSMFVVAGQPTNSTYINYSIVLLNAVIGFLIITTTYTGHMWLSQVFRQGSYILVAIEKPIRETGEKHQALWIMATRSEALLHAKTKWKGRRSAPGADLQSFIVRQAGLATLASVIMVLVLGMHDHFTAQGMFNNCVQVVLIIASIVVPLVWLKEEYKRSKFTLAEHTQHWMKYFENPTEHDEALLRTYDVNVAHAPRETSRFT
jgi:hypothetical protein